MRGSIVLLCWLAAAHVSAKPAERRGPARWQQSTSAPALDRVWGVGAELYGVGASGAHRSTDGGATWTQVGDPGAAIGVWGSGLDDVWVVRARSVHHSIDGAGEHWTKQPLAVSSTTQLEGMWGSGRELYVFGTDRSLRSGVVLHSRDGGTTWQREAIDLELVTGMWGSDPDNVYAVGARGVVMRSDGFGDWKMVRAPIGNGSLEGIWGTSRNAIYAVGSGGTILFSNNGTSWTTRTSGVTYGLSSIVGLSSKELYIGSKDGPPLRSTDGLTWRPITALVPRGNVWANGEHVVATAGDVHFVGERAAQVAPIRSVATPAPTQPPLPPLTIQMTETMTVREALALRLTIETVRMPHTYRRDLFRIATSRFGARFPIPPRLASVGSPPRVEVRSATGCGSFVPVPARTAVDELVGDAICEMTCTSVTVKVKVQVRRNGTVTSRMLGSGEVPIASCSAQSQGVRDGLQVVNEALVSRQYLPHLDTQLQDDLKNARTMDEYVDALAYHVMAGGQSGTARTLLATALGVTPQWPGFFWNAGPNIHRRATDICVGAKFLERDAEESESRRRFAEAAETFEAIGHCNPLYVEQAYLNACLAGDARRATTHYARLPTPQRSALLPACTKRGVDPRTP